jgi:hypothetical protein
MTDRNVTFWRESDTAASDRRRIVGRRRADAGPSPGLT